MRRSRELLGDVAERVHGAALFECVRPELACRFPEAGCPVGHQERRRPEPAGDQVAAEVEPVLVALPAAELEAEQDLAALERDAPGDEYTFGRLVVGAQLQVDRVQEAVDEVVLIKARACAFFCVSVVG